MRKAFSLRLRGVYVLLVISVLYSAATAQELRRIHYGTTTSTAHLPIWVAKDAGFFAKQGLNVEPVHIRGGALITMGIMSGQLQFSGAGAESIVAARIEGGDVVLLACPVDSDPVYFIARPEIKSAAELKGKATAVTRLGSTTHFYMRAAARHVGLDPEKDMTILQLGTGSETVSALENGRIACRRDHPSLRPAVLAEGLAAARRLEHHGSCLPVLLRRQQPQLCKIRTQTGRKLPARLRRRHPAGAQRLRLRRKIIDEMVAGERCRFWCAKPSKPTPSCSSRCPTFPTKVWKMSSGTCKAGAMSPKNFIGRYDLFRDSGPLERALARP